MKLGSSQFSFSFGGSGGRAWAPQQRFLADTKETIMHVWNYQSWWILWYLKEQGSLCHFINSISLLRLSNSSLFPPYCQNNPSFLKLIWKENGSWTSHRWQRAWVALALTAPASRVRVWESQGAESCAILYYSGILRGVDVRNTTNTTDCNSNSSFLLILLLFSFRN